MNTALWARNHYSPIDIGQGIFISHRDFCPQWTIGKTLHIWRDDLLSESYSCQFVQELRSAGQSLMPDVNSRHLMVQYKDGESLTKMNVSIEEIAQFSTGTLPLLIHCTVGQTRAPTLALIAKIVRGVSVYHALADIMQANWETRGVVSNFCCTPVAEILAWATH
mgnify:CR=1 FL=1